MKLSSQAYDVLLGTYFSQTLSRDTVTQTNCQRDTVTQSSRQQDSVSHTDSLTLEHVLAVWNCPCRQGCTLPFVCFHITEGFVLRRS